MNKPACLLMGDPFLVQGKSQSIVSQLKKKTAGETAERRVLLSEISLEAVLADARTLPFLCAAQVFHLRQAEILKTKDLEVLARYLENPASFSFLCFESAGLQKNRELAVLISRYGEVFFLEDALKKGAGLQIIKETVRSAGKTLDPGVLERLQAAYGEAPEFLQTQLQQLIALAGDQKEITESMAEALEEDWQKVDVFGLVEAISSRKTGEAFGLLEKLLEENDRDLVSLLGLLHWQIRRLWLAKVFLEEGRSENMILRRCRVNPRQAPLFMEQAKSFSRRKIEEALEALFQMDWKIKTGRVDGAAGLEAWVARVTQ